MTDSELISHEEDDPNEPVLVGEGDSDGVRIIICMTKEGSKRLLGAQYLQSDMAFKRMWASTNLSWLLLTE